MGRKIIFEASLQGHDFKKYIKGEKSVEVSRKLLALSHVQEGKSCTETARIVRVHYNTVQKWVRNFHKGGLERLQHQPGQGMKKRVKEKDLPQIKAGILALQAARRGGRITAHDIKKYLFEEWGVQYQETTIYNLLKDLKLVWISARSKHPISSTETQNTFKKTSFLTSKQSFLLKSS